MWDLVRNPEDRFSHNEAHVSKYFPFSDTGVTIGNKKKSIVFEVHSGNIIPSKCIDSDYHNIHVQFKFHAHLS